MNQIKGSGPLVFCNCDKCKGQIEYEYEHMLDPTCQAISRWCANFMDLKITLETMPAVPRTNAEFELRKRGAKTFYVIYFNAPLDPYEKFKELHPLFREIGENLKP